MPKEQVKPIKTLSVFAETHQRVLKRKFKMQSEEDREISIDELINELLDLTEVKKKIKKAS